MRETPLKDPVSVYQAAYAVRKHGMNISLRWHYPNQVTGNGDNSRVSACFVQAPLNRF